MPKKLYNALSAGFVRTVKKPGVYTDGNGLSLRVAKDSGRSWFVRYRLKGVSNPLSLSVGRYPEMGLQDARREAIQVGQWVKAGLDPRQRHLAAQSKEPEPDPQPEAGDTPEVPSFREVAKQVIDFHAPTWSSPRHAKQWTESLTNHAYPSIGDKPVDAITTADTLNLLTPIWTQKQETAKRVRQRMETVFDFAIAQGWCADNPATGVLLKALPKMPKTRQHHPALRHYSDVPAALRSVRECSADEITKLAFEFMVLTAARTGEVRGMPWAEIDMDQATWTIPEKRMKARREHRVPLSDQACGLLSRAKELEAEGELVFPTRRSGAQMSNMVFEMLVRRLELPCVPHGFRSSFRDWTLGATSFKWQVGELALAHTIGPDTVAAYARTDLFDERREMMQQWADFAAG